MYKTIKQDCVTNFTEKKSRFISYISHVTSETQAVDFLKKIKDKHWDATHHVYAYVLKNNQIQRYSDDGEPRATAGIPVLNILLKSEIYDVIVVVVRYFGGTLLGAGGLVRAYSNSCKLALEKSEIVFVHLCQKFLITFDYNLYSQIQTLLLNYHNKILNKIYNNNVCLEIAVRDSSFDKLSEELLNLCSGNIIIKKLEKLEMALS
ncbi:MAG: YigZ family protein [Oscillospiraceae bacterium]|nr:YigZ family protein [Oscillospiraceae bacterium]